MTEPNKLWYVAAEHEDASMDLLVIAQDSLTAARLWQTYYRDWSSPGTVKVTQLPVDVSSEMVQRALPWDSLNTYDEFHVASLLQWSGQ